MLLTVIPVSLGVVFAWGVLAPRNQWHCLIGWTRDNPRATEPGPAVYRLIRLLSLAGLVALSFGPVSALIDTAILRVSAPTASSSTLEKVWGQPEPVILDRVFTAARIPPGNLVSGAITGYQNVDNVQRTPAYLFAAPAVRDTGIATQPGFLGVVPRVGSTALATASLIVRVRSEDRCFPQQVVVLESADTVQIGVYFGPAAVAIDGSGRGTPDSRAKGCDPSPPATRTRAFLVPVDLAAPLDQRTVQLLSGKPIPSVALPTG